MNNYRHYVSMDLYGNGIGYNVVIIKEDENTGDVYFIKEEDLDIIDRKRMRQILAKRNAEQFPLWDLLAQTTLKNGVNALDYFHQMVQVRTTSGQIIPPSSVRQGIRQPIQPKVQAHRPTPVQPDAAPTEATPAKKSPGRPPGRPKKNASS